MSKTKIMQEVENILRDFGDKYYIDKHLLKSRVIQDIDLFDAELMGKLLKNETIRNNFTLKVADVTIFNTNEFISIFEASEYWDDSYTKYQNKIGLNYNGTFLDESAEVVLDFPYKDTVLKASMSKEEVEVEDLLPNEPFLNEIIAREEIDVLFDKKILVNATKYDKDGEHKVSEFSEDDNLIIKGNNLIALHSLDEKYKRKVKLIYIDIPYYFINNKENNSFKYNSNFKLSSWLIFMKNRLEVSKKLIAEDGSIWIHVGEDGMHYLKVLADQIFGQDKFVGTLPRKTREGKNDVPFNFSQDFDFILIYTKGEKTDSILKRKISRNYTETHDFPGRPWRRGDIKQQKNYKQRPNSYFDMVNPKTGKVYPVDKDAVWRVTKDTFDEWYSKGYIGFPDDYSFMSGETPFRRSFKDEDEIKDKEKGSSVFSDFLLKDFVQQIMGKGKTAKDDYVNNQDFNYAKPESLINSIIEVATDEKDVVLDFFMGSSTTQSVAMKMNRKFIGVEQMDYINTVSVPRLQKVIEGEQCGISKNVNWQGGGSFVYVELMKKSQGYLMDVLNAASTDELKKAFNLMLANADFDFRVNLEEVKDSVWQLSLDDQKRTLVRIIDKNQLYYNYSEIDDENVRDIISDSDYAFNQSFYKDKEE